MIRGRERVSTQVRMWLNYPYPNFPSKENLVGYWAFNEGTGTTAFDNSGNSNHGTLVNMEEADWVDGVVGKCLSFDGVNEYVSVPDSVSVGKSITVLAWVKSATVDWNTLGWIASFRGNNGFIIHPASASKAVSMYIISSTSDYVQIGTVTPADITQWHLYGVIYNDDTKKGYTVLDGEIVESSHDITRLADIIPVEIGRDYGFVGRFGNGLIDEVRIYNTALTASEVKALYDYPGGV